jgi:ABC-type Fe3+/spermidine/putrescine transport system ATPase subunit
MDALDVDIAHPLRSFRLELALSVGARTIALAGPSGAGKTTVLRAIAGLVRPERGRITLGERPWFDSEQKIDVPPEERSVGLVFQEYALFPHMTVEQNVAYGGRARVGELLDLLGISQLRHARPEELSGGERQRVALARALATEPRVLLLDEPLSALDLKIRLEMEAELRRVHRETGATFVYVTHDQREALALSDRIVVLEDGRIEQVGVPNEIYRRPASPFAARFVGDANVIPVDVVSTAGERATVAICGREVIVPCANGMPQGPAWLVLRPEVVRLGRRGAKDGSGIDGVIRDLAFRGAGYSYRVEVAGLVEPVKAEMPAEVESPLELGSEVSVTWDLDACGLLPRERAGA